MFRTLISSKQRSVTCDDRVSLFRANLNMFIVYKRFLLVGTYCDNVNKDLY